MPQHAARSLLVCTDGVGPRTATLGELDPVVVARWDVPLFVVMSALAAFGGRIAATRFQHVRATAVQVAIFWGVLLGVVPLVISAFEQRWQLSVRFLLSVGVAGCVVFALASALGIWAAVVMSTRGAGTPLPSDTATRFVGGGPYRFVRNPMALAGITQGAAVGSMVSSWLVVIYAVCGSLVWNFIVRPHEERDLEARFGDAFHRYREQVRCWWPRLRPIPASVTAGVPQPVR